MNHQEYVAARHGRLVDHALELGCSEQEARTQVARVLEEQRRHIAASDDPDPGVRSALARRIAGEPERRRSRWTPVAVAVVVLVLVAGAVLLRPGPRSPLPSLLGYDAATAARLLTEAGYEVVTERSEACEPRGRVLGSDPVPGTPVRAGATVTLRAAIPSDAGCLATFAFRVDAWDFVDFVRGGPPPGPPGFAPLVAVHLDGVALALLGGREAADLGSWPDVLGPVEQALADVAPTRSAMPRLLVDSLVPPARSCGVPVPAGLRGRLTLRVLVDPSPDGTTALCPVGVDLYRDEDRRIEAVVVYSGVVRDTRPGSGDPS